MKWFWKKQNSPVCKVVEGRGEWAVMFEDGSYLDLKNPQYHWNKNQVFFNDCWSKDKDLCERLCQRFCVSFDKDDGTK